jgi:hypothetical protein
MQIVALSFLLALDASAQTFEVVSVRPFKGGPPGFQGVQPGCKGGHFAAVTPAFLTMEWAYDMTPGQATEFQAKMPLWAQSISGAYELQATTRPDVTEDECRKMAQHLFEDRFYFKYHLGNRHGQSFRHGTRAGRFEDAARRWFPGLEHCLLAVRGKPVFIHGRHSTALEAARREHSRKPEEFYALVEATSPGRRVELFAREQRKGWRTFGNETGRFGHK